MKSKIIASIAFLTLLFSLAGVSAATAQSGEDAAQVAAGESVFSSSCAGCHGADGTGSATGRPLTGIAGQQPDRTVHIASVTDGIGSMPAFGDRLSEDEIDAAVAYVRATFQADAGELPRTGTERNPLLFGGAALLAAGAALTVRSRRFDTAA